MGRSWRRNDTSPTVQTHCTVCGAERPLCEPGFGEHQRSERHRQAVQSSPVLDAIKAAPNRHHAGHIAMGIACGCDASAAVP
jgi:hypothetical protein